MELQLKIKKPVNILVKRRAAIGDVIMITGVVRELKKLYGDTANIYVSTDSPSVFRCNPHIAGVITYTDPTAAFDVVYNLDDAYEYNTGSHFVDCYFHRVFGHTDFDKRVELFPSEEDQSKVEKDLEDLGDKFIVMHMRNWHWGAKNIDMDVWFSVLEKLFTERTDFNIVCVGGETDHYVDHPLIFDGRTHYNDQQLKYLLDHAACFVGIDSAPFHCAAASKTHIVALLTHLNPECIMPYRNGVLGDNCTVVQTQEDCRGCNERQQTPVRQIVCEKGNTPCTKNFDADAIAQAILKTL
jgi:ADP-heptose:LPS heptosyltransferase